MERDALDLPKAQSAPVGVVVRHALPGAEPENEEQYHEEIAGHGATKATPANPIQGPSTQSAAGLVREHAVIMLLMAFNLVMMDNNNVFLYFLLVQTSAGCYYHDDGGAYVKSQIVTLVAVLAFRPIASWLTDQLPERNHILLFVAALIEMSGLLAMLVLVAQAPLGTVSPWSVLSISVLKQCAEVQINTSIFKIFKMRLERVCLLGTCDSQCRVISTVGICGEMVELTMNLCVAISAYFLIVNYAATFATIKYFYFAITILGNLGCLMLAGSICRNATAFYAVPLEHIGGISSVSAGSVNSGGLPLGNQISHRQVDSERPSMSASMLPALDGTESTALLHREGDGGGGRACSGEQGVCGGLAKAVMGIAGIPVAMGAIVHMFLVFSSQELMYDVQSLAVPGADINASKAVNATAANFCAGYLTNTVFQDVFENTFYLAGTVFFVAVLRQIAPTTFYSRLFPVCMTLLLGVSVVLSRPEIGELELALSMMAVVAFNYFFYLYSKFLSTAAIRAEHYGFYSFLVGLMQSCVDLSIYGAMEANVGNTVMLYTLYAFMGTAVVFSLAFARGQRGQLQGANAQTKCT
mmetsp:Transcript_10245/g.30844  ORF Transcript_10245/g.30844 Transcript_10245/m.30844 type:complete len:583 (+) Transcript_10245:60-1808(+)|eukprot:CAMPEP_0206326706 /NCGR_PEP_ID=MMETSP0106_2-20121207/21758_1 /ASSEMBLY_ACC=CAM_ASM_000206 /TAXON_ID=81532 /ORGANISM="Acanthoeca-like sp., Strain 10tr" /LENGTH=582 /DNA_ID=CAMNT_0053759275 /DNA_START=30 /DNA_END=1778 /DNA_ORIENTATION=-